MDAVVTPRVVVKSYVALNAVAVNVVTVGAAALVVVLGGTVNTFFFCCISCVLGFSALNMFS